MKITGLLALLLFAVRVNANNGYVVLATGDTVYGKVTWKWSFVKGGSVTVRKDGAKQTISQSAVNHYVVRGRKYYLFPTIHGTKKRAFIEPLLVRVDGQTKLLAESCRYSRYGSDYYVLLENGQLVYVNEKNYNNILIPLFNQSSSFQQKMGVKDTSYSRKRKGYAERLKQLILSYNG